MKDFEAQLSTFGDDQLKVLLSWYGEPKNRAGTIFPPLVDSNLCTKQWIGFREHLFSWYSAKKVSSVPSLARKVRSEAWASPRFAGEFSEVIKLVQIADVCPESTAECERMIHTAKRVMTKDRTR